MIYTGISLMIAAAIPLAGVLYELHHRLIKAFHARVWIDPLSPACTWVERRHLARTCAECSFIASTRTSHSVPVDIPAPRVIDC